MGQEGRGAERGGEETGEDGYETVTVGDRVTMTCTQGAL